MDRSGRRDFDGDPTPEPSPLPGKTNWPRISDYWPDNPRRHGSMHGDRGGADRRVAAGLDDQTLAYNQIYPANQDVDLGAPPHSERGVPAYGIGGEEPAPTRLISALPHRRPRFRLAVTAAGTAVFLGFSGLALARLVDVDGDETAGPAAAGGGVAAGAGEPGAPVPISPTSSLPPSTPVATSSPGPTASRPAGGPAKPGAAGPAFAAGTFVLADNVTEVNLTLGRPPGSVVRAGTPPDSGLTTRAATAGTTVTLTAKPTGKPGSGRVDVQLDERIAWTIRMTGGVRTGTFALAGGTVRAVDLAGGADTIDLVLPRTSGALPIRMSGGVHTWRIHTEREEPVLVNVREGAGAVTLYGRNDGGVDKGRQVSAGSGAGLQIDAVAGIGSLTVSAGL